MENFQLSLFYNFQVFIQSSNFYRKYYLLFKSLPLTNINDRNYGTGRIGYSRHVMIRAFIVKNLEQIKSIPMLIEFLDANPMLTQDVRFQVAKKLINKLNGLKV